MNMSNSSQVDLLVSTGGYFPAHTASDFLEVYVDRWSSVGQGPVFCETMSSMLRSCGISPRASFETCGEGEFFLISHTLHGTGIFTYIWLKSMVNVDKYFSPMDPMGVDDP